MRRAGNVSPLISVEGGADSYADRRGNGRAYGRALDALTRCKEQGLVTGVATSVSVSTYADVVSERFVDDMAARGAHYLCTTSTVPPVRCPVLKRHSMTNRCVPCAIFCWSRERAAKAS